MAGNGPAPKDRRGRDRDNKALQDLVYNGQVFGDPLPDGVLGELDGEPIAWHPQTIVWWESLRKWPLMEGEPDVSWQFMVDTALMHHTMWTKGRWEFASEIRLRVAKYGIMPDDRKRLGVKYHPYPEMPEGGETPKGGNVTNISSRMNRLLDE